MTVSHPRQRRIAHGVGPHQCRETYTTITMSAGVNTIPFPPLSPESTQIHPVGLKRIDQSPLALPILSLRTILDHHTVVTEKEMMQHP